MWDKDSIQRLLAENDRAVARAVVAIYNAQTEQEKSSETTHKANGVGFNQADARRGTYYADYVNRTGRLTGRHLEIARKMMMKYWRQLADVANAKAGVAVESKANPAAPFRARLEGEDVGNYEEARMVHEEFRAMHGHFMANEAAHEARIAPGTWA